MRSQFSILRVTNRAEGKGIAQNGWSAEIPLRVEAFSVLKREPQRESEQARIAVRRGNVATCSGSQSGGGGRESVHIFSTKRKEVISL